LKHYSLLDNWTLREEPLSCPPELAPAILQKQEGWMSVPTLPCDVHMALMDAGRIGEPLEGGNSFDCKWVEDRSWWFRKTFVLTAEDLNNFGAELFIEILDIHADLFLNGTHIGHHASAFFPFQKNVSSWLVEGENVLLIRLSCGLEHVDDRDIATMRNFVSCDGRTRQKGRGDDRRIALRKPQYVFGWDQSPRLATCAIAGDVRLDFLDEVVVRDVRVETLSLSDAGAQILAQAQVESRCPLFARECEATFTFEKDGQVVYEKTVDFLAQAGTNYLKFDFTLPNPQLWWPNGYGDQPLYTARVVARNVGGARDEQSVRTGIRTVELDNSKYSDVERRYAFRVNGKQIYCKGMDLIHTDHIYARAKRETYESLIRDAKAAHFTMFRFWAEGVYEPDYVYELCDEQGILVYRTMIFACGAYPDHLPWFNDLVEQEVRYQMLRLRNHPCMAVWCGGGECLSVLNSYFGAHYPDHDDITRRPGGTTIYGQLMPRIHHELIASVPYVCNSAFGMLPADQAPYRGGGDRHFYPFLNTKPEYQQTRISVDSFADFKAQFVTEGGVMGPPSPQALIRYCGGREHIADDDPIFTHHRNSFEYFAVRDAVYRHYTGEKQLSLEEYCLYGGLFQGDLLSYEADQIRTTENCSGSVLWCYTDGFGEVGFSLMDHYANPKPAYYFMRRAYHPHRVVVRRCEDELRIYCANDLPEAATLDLTCGYVSFDGTYAPARTLTVRLDAFTQSALIATVPVDGSWDLQRGAFYVRGEGIPTVTFRAGDFRTLTLPRATLSVSDFCREGDTLHFTVQTDCFAHAVHFNLGDEVRLSDQYFDLLPGESRRISIFNADGITPDMVRPTSVYPD